MLPSSYRAFVAVLLDYTNAVDAGRRDAVVTVLLPEFVTTYGWQHTHRIGLDAAEHGQIRR